MDQESCAVNKLFRAAMATGAVVLSFYMTLPDQVPYGPMNEKPQVLEGPIKVIDKKRRIAIKFHAGTVEQALGSVRIGEPIGAPAGADA